MRWLRQTSHCKSGCRSGVNKPSSDCCGRFVCFIRLTAPFFFFFFSHLLLFSSFSFSIFSLQPHSPPSHPPHTSLHHFLRFNFFWWWTVGSKGVLYCVYTPTNKNVCFLHSSSSPSSFFSTPLYITCNIHSVFIHPHLHSPSSLLLLFFSFSSQSSSSPSLISALSSPFLHIKPTLFFPYFLSKSSHYKYLWWDDWHSIYDE